MMTLGCNGRMKKGAVDIEQPSLFLDSDGGQQLELFG